MFAMAQMNAATPEAAVNNDATNAEAPALTAPVDDDDSPIVLLDKSDAKLNKNWAIFTDGFYLGLGIKHNWEPINNSFEVGILNLVGLKYNSLHGQTITLGAGFHHRSYSMKRPNMLTRDAASQIVTVIPYPSEIIGEIKNRSSNLNMWTMQFPLMFTQRIYKKLNIGVAGIMNWNVYARVDNHFEMNKTDYDIRHKNLRQNKLNFDVLGSLTWNQIGVYCRYSPGKFFEEGYGPEIKNTWTLGLMIGL
jgi:hypothetical protein